MCECYIKLQDYYYFLIGLTKQKKSGGSTKTQTNKKTQKALKKLKEHVHILLDIFLSTSS